MCTKHMKNLPHPGRSLAHDLPPAPCQRGRAETSTFFQV